MGLWQAVLAFLAPRSRTARRSWDPATNPFDAERVAQQLRLKEQGRELGESGVPLAADTSLSGPEGDAVLAVEQAQTDYIESYQQRLKALQVQASRSDLSAKLAEALSSVDQFERQAGNLLTENATQLQRFEEVARSRREALVRFREKHRRIELPDYPSDGKRLFLLVLAIALVVGETALNASFFSMGLGGGLLQGMVEAFSFSLANVGLALTAGIVVVRFNNHVQVAWRLAGYACTAVVIGGIVTLALMVSHYRDALYMSAENAGAMAKQALFTSPFDLAGPSSWILFACSCLAGCVAVWEGYSLDERYPGYGHVHRRSEEAAKRYDRAVQALRGALAKYRQNLISRIEQTQQACETSIVDLKGVIDNKQRLGDEMSNQIRSLQSAVVALVETFRTANKVGRQGNPVPEYFNTKPRLDERALPDFSTGEERALLARQEVAAAEFLRTKADLCAKIESGFNDRYSSLLTVKDLFDLAPQSGGKPVTVPATLAQVPASATVVPLRTAGADGGVST